MDGIAYSTEIERRQKIRNGALVLLQKMDESFADVKGVSPQSVVEPADFPVELSPSSQVKLLTDEAGMLVEAVGCNARLISELTQTYAEAVRRRAAFKRNVIIAVVIIAVLGAVAGYAALSH